MRNRLTTFALLLVMAIAWGPAASAGPYDVVICPMIRGQFLLIEGSLWVEINREDGKEVATRREKIANPLEDRSHEALTKRGNVSVEVHHDKKKGGLFVHWGTLKDAD